MERRFNDLQALARDAVASGRGDDTLRWWAAESAA
jgi:hypothetical protein